jgi:hypothetical protein
MIKLCQPYILERKVLTEKSVKGEYVKIESVMTATIKKSIAIAILGIIGVLFSYISISFAAFSLDMPSWSSSQRVFFLLVSIVGALVTYLYSGYYIKKQTPTGHNNYEDGHWEKINILSENWFKKILSIFVIYFIVSFVCILILSFCAMSLDVSKMKDDDRCAFVFVPYFITVALCCLAHHNNLNMIIKVEEP